MMHRLRAVQFVKAKNTDKGLRYEDVVNEKRPEEHEEVGKQAREFYESVIASSSSQSPGPQPRASEQAVTRTRSKRCTLPQSRGQDRSQKRANLPERTSGGALNKLLRHCQEGSLRDVKKLLRQGGASLQDSDQYGWNALMCAAYSGHVNVVTFILKSDLSVLEHRNKKGQSAIELAQMAGNEAMVRLLQQFKQSNSTMDGQRATGSGNSSSGSRRPLWCEVCEAEFRDVKRVHEQSTVHLFSCGHAPHPTLYHIPESNRGFRLMLQDGWDKEKGLGKAGEGHKFPVKTVLKRDRQGLGADGTDSKPRITHFKPYDTEAIKRPRKEHEKRKDKVKRKDGASSMKGKHKFAERDKNTAMEIDFRMSFST